MKEIVHSILKNIKEQKPEEDTPVFSNPELKPEKISEKNFHELQAKKTDKKTCYVDGGNAELITANNLSLHFIRVAGIVYKNNKKTLVKKKEFYCLTTFKNNQYKTKIFPKNAFEELEFDSFDKTIREGQTRINISKIGLLIRRLAELSIAKELTKEADYLVLDGSLEEKFTHEEKFLKELFEKADKNQTIIGGLSKTNAILTKKGNSLSTLLYNMKKGKWYYHPVIKNAFETLRWDLYFVKLKENSKHVFRLDAHNNAEELISELASMSKDPVFIGYPYGLIQADRIARISNRESDFLKTKLMINFSKDWKTIKKYLTTKNAHEILDNIS